MSSLVGVLSYHTMQYDNNTLKTTDTGNWTHCISGPADDEASALAAVFRQFSYSW